MRGSLRCILVGVLLGSLGLLLPLPAFAAPPASTRPTCATQPSVCSLRGAAERAGIRIGAALEASLRPNDVRDVLAHFNAVTSENAFKWSEMEATRGVITWNGTDALVQWSRAHRLRLRAHTLFWHRMQIPAWVRQTVTGSADPPATLQALMQERVSRVVGRYRGQVAIWDVANEPTAIFGRGWDQQDSPWTPQNFFYTTLGERYLDVAFRAARAADPQAKLFLNEIVWNPELGDPKADGLLALVQRLRARNVPVDGVGLQLHAVMGVREPWFPANSAKLLEYLNALGRTGVKVELTEMDVSLPKVIEAAGLPAPAEAQALAMQARLFGGAVGACARARACTGVTVWGLRDNDTWLDRPGQPPSRPLLLDADGLPKLAYVAVRDALLLRCPATGRQPRRCSTAWP